MSNLYREISNALSELLIGREYLIEPFPTDISSLFLLLTLNADKVGFAILNDRPEENYSQAFEKLRELYSIHSTEWADFDLTLVLCKTGAKKIPDELCNEIEMDPYFCRKLVIDSSKELKVELGGLPFIPLRPESIIGLKRPISAQTFLMKHGVTSNLAKYLAVPHIRAEERIATECIEGVLGKPEWLKAEIDEFLLPQYEVKVRPAVRLKELEISNFRAYRGSHKFDLDADLIVLYGPNGFGKTSFLDAIDFVCTGGVGRFNKRFGQKTDRLVKVLKHLDSSKDDSWVKATVLIDDKEEMFERYMKNRAQTYINGTLKDRTETLMLLTGLSEGPPDLRIENLVHLLYATHIFGQEYQTLTPVKFREESNLPQDTVSRMLAFQDYVEAKNKTKKVSEELNRRIREKESEIVFLNNSLKPKEAKMEELSQSAKIVEKPEAVLAIGKKIAEKLIGKANISIEVPKEINQKIVRDWRGLIEAQINYITQNLEVIEKLEAKFSGYMMHRREEKERSIELIQRKELLNKLNEDYSKSKKEREVSDERLRKMILEAQSLVLKQENLKWLLESKVEYEQLKKQIAKENEDYQDIKAQLLKLSSKVEKLKSGNKTIEDAIGNIKSGIKVAENSLRELADFEKGADDWQKRVSHQKELELNLQRTDQQFIDMKNEMQIKKNELITAIITQDKLRTNIDNLQQSQSEIQTLLDNIERHIPDNICPVCGTLHKSREDLMERLKFQRGIQPKEIQEALKLFEDVRAKTDGLKRQVGDIELKFKQLEQKVEEIQKELFDTAKRVRTYEERANLLDIPINSENLMAVIGSQKKELDNQINAKQLELSRQKSKANKQEEELTSFVNEQKSLEQNLRTIEPKLNLLKSKIEEIEGGALNRRISLELEEEVIQWELSETKKRLESLHKELRVQQLAYKNLEKNLFALKEKKDILEKEIQELDREILDLKKYIEEVEILIKRLNLNLDIDKEQVQILKESIRDKLSYLDSLQNEIINFEIALDAVQISASLAEIQRDAENIRKQIKEVEKEQSWLNAWRLYFDVAHKELERLQKRALEEYTTKYGPLTSTIQRRLRPVYGFGDIELHQGKGGIAVQVERKGERNIAPSDYFSESQIQILMLSLFLSAGLTQTWSSFAPILLDDPVTHFDDLNAYSLFDLIRGLIMKPDKKPQFIISTCEERFYRLMRQKFSKLNGRVIFYIFESIGENGPKIKKEILT